MPTDDLRRRFSLGNLALIAIGTMLAASPSKAVAVEEQVAAPPAAGDTERVARTLLSDGKPTEAIALLKTEIERQPHNQGLRLWLARAYLDDDNGFWALRTVAAAAERSPEDCNLTLWQGFIQLRQDALDQAREVLRSACASWAPVEARRALLLAMVEERAGAQLAAQTYLDQAHAARFAFPEDRNAILQLQGRLHPGYLAPLSGRLDLAMGGTTNARAGSPVDPASQGNGGESLAVSFSGSMRFVSPNRSWARLSLEGEARGLTYQAEAVRDLSYLTLSGRPGVLLDGWGRSILLGYRYEALLLAAGDRFDKGPVWFSGAHRGEWELEILPELTLFGGAGQRAFREAGRTRTEVDGGVGTALPAGEMLHLVGALAGRYHDAKNDAYDQRGVSLLLSTELRAKNRWTARAGLLASADWYPHSAGYFDPPAPDAARSDRLLQLSFSVFAPPLKSRLKLGLTYEFATRDSTAPLYDYMDHRVLAKAIWSFTADPWLPRAATPIGHVPLDYGLAASEVGERVQDLLRQGEATQRSSSCRD